MTSLLIWIAWRLRALALVFVRPGIRRIYHRDMDATFADSLADARSRGSSALLRAIALELRDLTRSRRATIAAPIGASLSARPPRLGTMLVAVSTGWMQAWRSLARRPAYATASIVTLSAATATLATVFAVVDTVLIKPLPYPRPDGLVTIYESSLAARDRTSLVAPARLADWQTRSTAFSAISASYTENVTDTSAAEPERLEGRRVLPRFFDVYAMPPVIGRYFTDDEEVFGGPGAAIISDRFWERRFGRDRRVLERALAIGGRAYAIVGVMPAAFTGGTTDVWLPAQVAPQLMAFREARFVAGVGRLRDGVDVDTGTRDLVRVQEALGREHPKTDHGWSVQVAPLKAARIGDAGRGLILLFGAVGALWLIAIANVIALTLMHVERRRRELDLRRVLGASRAQVLAVLARETMLLGCAAIVLGGVVAAWTTSLLPTLLPALPRMNELTFNVRTVAVIGGAMLLAVLAATLVPLLSRARPVGSGERSVAANHHAAQRAIVVIQIALCMTLLGASSLLIRSYYKTSKSDLGFAAADAITFHVGARWDEDRAAVGRLQRDLLARLAELPHVSAAGMTNFLPATSATLRFQVRVDGVVGSNADGTANVGARMVGGGYLQAIGARFVRGRPCATSVDGTTPAREAIVNQRFIDVYANGADVTGRSLRVAQGAPDPFRIVGVIADIAEDGPGTSPFPYAYTCDAPGSWPDPEYVVLTSRADALPADLRRVVRELDPSRAVFGLRPVADVIDAALERPRFDAATLSLFTLAAVLLAATGIYSLFSLIVAGSRRALAIRIALGASDRDVRRLVVGGAARLLAIGITFGIAVSLTGDRLLQAFVSGARSSDPRSIAMAAAVLCAVAAFAVLAPARRASRTSPIDALHPE